MQRRKCRRRISENYAVFAAESSDKWSLQWLCHLSHFNKSSAVAEMGIRGPHLTQKSGSCAPLVEGDLGPQHNVARAEAYLHAKFHLDPPNRLATVHERHRQDRQTTV